MAKKIRREFVVTQVSESDYALGRARGLTEIPAFKAGLSLTVSVRAPAPATQVRSPSREEGNKVMLLSGLAVWGRLLVASFIKNRVRHV